MLPTVRVGRTRPEPLVLAQRLRMHVQQPRGHADKVEIVFDCHASSSSDAARPVRTTRACVDPNIDLDTSRVKVGRAPEWTFTLSDFLTIGLLVLLEGLLSADNALVLAILVLGLPRERAAQGAALRHCRRVRLPHPRDAAGRAPDAGRLGQAGRRAYLLYLTCEHFFGRGDSRRATRAIKPARPWLGLSAFWATVVKVELTDIVFAVDSILVAVAMSPQAVGHHHRRHPRHRRDAAGDRPAAGAGAALSRARRRRVRHHRAGSGSSCCIEYLHAEG